MITMAMNIIRQGPAFDGPSVSPSPHSSASLKPSGLS
jgi:hypothetical protein